MEARAVEWFGTERHTAHLALRFPSAALWPNSQIGLARWWPPCNGPTREPIYLRAHVRAAWGTTWGTTWGPTWGHTWRPTGGPTWNLPEGTLSRKVIFHADDCQTYFPVNKTEANHFPCLLRKNSCISQHLVRGPWAAHAVEGPWPGGVKGPQWWMASCSL